MPNKGSFRHSTSRKFQPLDSMGLSSLVRVPLSSTKRKVYIGCGGFCLVSCCSHFGDALFTGGSSSLSYPQSWRVYYHLKPINSLHQPSGKKLTSRRRLQMGTHGGHRPFLETSRPHSTTSRCSISQIHTKCCKGPNRKSRSFLLQVISSKKSSQCWLYLSIVQVDLAAGWTSSGARLTE